MKTIRNKKGQGMIEYLMIAAFVVAVSIYMYQTLKPAATKSIDHVVTQMGNTN